jgi:murein DD-endopeptidase MepM/ murein hydrolase activator NlpD
MRPFVDFKTYNQKNPFGTVDPVFYPATKHHIGSDFVVPVGTPIYAPEDGEVLKVVFNAARGNTAIYVFRHGSYWGLEFCHLRELPLLGVFKRGDIIAYSGNTGTASTGPHLHVTLHKGALVSKDYALLTSEEAYTKLVSSGQLVDPYKWFTEHMA